MPKFARVIAVANQKGGVAKTTTAINLAASLATADQRILLVDMDPQANLTSGLGRKGQAGSAGTVYDALTSATSDPRAFVAPTSIDHLSLIAADRHLTGAEIELVTLPEREYRLRRLVDRLRGDFEYIFVDGRSFHSTPQSGGWKEYISEFPMDLGLDPRPLCDRIAAGQDTGPFPLYNTLLKRGFATRGEIKQVESGAQCCEWTVKVPRMGLADDSESFCLDVTTGLPLYRLTASGRYSFSDFNAPLIIDAPRAVGTSY